ncbi:MAG: CapA family protein [Lachnospiraceae bacterium]|nr:CapA family protein [Lachnospiraceae bacterium]
MAMKWNNRPGRRATGTPGTDKAVRHTKWIIAGGIAVVVSITAVFTLWWYGAFLPRWITWEEREFSYEGCEVILKNRTLRVAKTDMEDTGDRHRFTKRDQSEHIWKTPADWQVQDVLVMDIDRDQSEELVLLVWKHGSYGRHLPIWEKKNDIRLEQHIFIYRLQKNTKYEDEEDIRAQDETAAEGKSGEQNTNTDVMKPVWMSSSLGKNIRSIARGKKESLILNPYCETGISTLWVWKDFGLKYAGESKEQQAQVVCAGDNLIHLSLLAAEQKKLRDGEVSAGNLYDSFYDSVRDKLQNADLAAVNQETIFVADHKRVSDYPRFGTPTEVGDAMVRAGFNLITLANNHALDQGVYGIDTTTAFWEEKGISYVGAQSTKSYSEEAQTAVQFMEINGIRFAFAAYTYGTNGMPEPEGYPHLVEKLGDEDRMHRQLSYARSRADVVMVFVHWGTEYDTEIDDRQEYYRDFFYREGIDAVIGTHPHVVQKWEIVENNGTAYAADAVGWKKDSEQHKMLVYYSLGNLISAQTNEECKTGGLAEFTVVKKADGSICFEKEKLQ